MSKPRYRWWGYAKNVIRAYPQLKEAYNDSVPNAGAQELSGMPHSTGTNRTVENNAIRLASNYKEYHAVKQTIEFTLSTFNGEERMKIIDLLYWKQKYKRIEDCADEIHVSYHTAQIYHRDFVFMVGYHLMKD